MSQLTAFVRNRTGRAPKLTKQLTADIVDQAISEGKRMPLELFLEIMNSKPIPQQPDETPFDYNNRCTEHAKLRFEAAKAAAPFVHPRIVSLDPGVAATEGGGGGKLIMVPVASKEDSAA